MGTETAALRISLSEKYPWLKRNKNKDNQYWIHCLDTVKKAIILEPFYCRIQNIKGRRMIIMSLTSTLQHLVCIPNVVYNASPQCLHGEQKLPQNIFCQF